MSKYNDDWADKIEPYTAGLALAGDVIGLGTAATGVGAPIGATIAGIANIPNLAIDSYQAIRDWYRAINDGGEGWQSAAWNTGETALDLFGAKYAMKGAKFMSDKRFTDELAGRIADETKKRAGQRYLLRKKGMTDSEIAKYITQKATNAAINSKAMIDAKKKHNASGTKNGKIAGHTISALQNGYQLDRGIQENDATRVQKSIIIPIRLRKSLGGDY